MEWVQEKMRREERRGEKAESDFDNSFKFAVKRIEK